MNRREILMGGGATLIASFLKVKKVNAQEHPNLPQLEIDQDNLLHKRNIIEGYFLDCIENDRAIDFRFMFNSTKGFGEDVATFLKQHNLDDLPFEFDEVFTEFTNLLETINMGKISQEEIYVLTDAALDRMLKSLKVHGKTKDLRDTYIRGFLCGLDQRLCGPTG